MCSIFTNDHLMAMQWIKVLKLGMHFDFRDQPTLRGHVDFQNLFEFGYKAEMG